MSNATEEAKAKAKALALKQATALALKQEKALALKQKQEDDALLATKIPNTDDDGIPENDEQVEEVPERTLEEVEEEEKAIERKKVSEVIRKATKEAKDAKKGIDQAQLTKDILAVKKHISFLVPIADGESQNAAETVQINGYRLTIKKGVMVVVPEAVALILAEKYRIGMTAGAKNRIDRDDETLTALG